MNKVYCLLQSSFDETNLLGVYSTEEKAIAALKLEIKGLDCTWFDDGKSVSTPWDSYYISEEDVL